MHHLGLAAVAVALLTALLGALSFGIGPTGLFPVVWVLLGALPLLLLREFVRRLTIAHLQMATAVAIDAGVALLQLGSLLLLAYCHRLTVMSAYAAMGAACGAACCGWFLASAVLSASHGRTPSRIGVTIGASPAGQWRVTSSASRPHTSCRGS